MQLTTNITLARGIYTVAVSIPNSAFNGAELEALNQFGEPSVNMGGAVTGGSTTVTLPTDTRNIPSGLPYKVEFDYNSLGSDAGLLANAYAAAIRTRIADAVAAKVALSPNATLGSNTSVAEPS